MKYKEGNGVAEKSFVSKRLTAKTVQINKIKVLGNIHDNPGLVGGKNEV